MISKKRFVKILVGILLVNVVFIVGTIAFVNNKLSEKSEAALDQSSADTIVGGSGDLYFDYDVAYDASPDPEIVSAEERENALLAKKAENSPEESFNSIYKVVLPGTYYPAENVAFKFDANGSFEGYYDADNPMVNGYSYEVGVNSDGQNIVTVYNQDRSTSVIYLLDLDDIGNIILSVPGAEISYKLGV